MSEFTLSKSVKDLRIETDFKELLIRVYQDGNVVRQIDCSKMSLKKYLQAIDNITAETIANEN